MLALFSPRTYQLASIHKSALVRGIFTFTGLLLGLALGIEIAARLFFIPFPSLGSDNFYFDYKIYALERHGQLDCLVIGSSVAHFNLDPDVIEQSYQQATGKKIECFNLGIPALTVENAVTVTEAVLVRHRPKVVLFIIMPRDLMNHEFSVKQLETNPWVDYQRGEFTWQDWLKVNSYSLRYFTTWQYWQTLANRDKMALETSTLTPNGYAKIDGLNDPCPRNWLLENDETLQNVWMDGQGYANLDRLLDLEKHGSQFIFIEAPAYSVIHLERGDPAIYHYENTYIANLQSYLERKNIPFWRSLEIGKQIPEGGWYDWLHLNSAGAPILSRWVAEKLAETPGLFK